MSKEIGQFSEPCIIKMFASIYDGAQPGNNSKDEKDTKKFIIIFMKFRRESQFNRKDIFNVIINLKIQKRIYLNNKL